MASSHVKREPIWPPDAEENLRDSSDLKLKVCVCIPGGFLWYVYYPSGTCITTLKKKKFNLQ